MRTTALLASLVAAPALAGEPILVPDFTPASTTEFAIAFMLQQQVADALRAHGHIVLDSHAVAPVVGESIAACAEVPGCPFAALQQLPARSAVVGRVARNADGVLNVFVAAYERGDSRPVDTREIEVVGGDEGAIAESVAVMVDDMLSLLGPGSSNDLVAAVALIEAADAPVAPPPDPDPDPGPGLLPPIGETRPPPPDLPTNLSPVVAPVAVDWTRAPLDTLLEGSTLKPMHLVGAEGAFRRARRPPREWARRAMPHAGRAIVELRGGFTSGDVSRHADIRVALAFDRTIASEWFQEGPVYGQQPRGTLFVGYAPSTWVDFGVAGGLQYGERSISTGWTDVDGNSGSGEDGVPAVQLLLEPRFRLYLVPLGPVKPYLVAGAELRAFDPYNVIDSDVDYPNPPGGSYGGPMGGGGLVIDAGPVVGLFAEGTYTRLLGVRANAAGQGEKPDGTPDPPRGEGYAVSIVGGLQFRI